MKRKLASIVVGVAVLTFLAALFTGASASADDYVAQRTAPFQIVNPAGNPSACTGQVWIGRTSTGSIEGATTVQCPGKAQFVEAQIVVYPRGEIKIALDDYEQCGLCRGVSVAHSERGGPGWCVRGAGIHAVAHPSGAGSTFGQAVVCV
jgi:hypothetical protein